MLRATLEMAHDANGLTMDSNKGLICGKRRKDGRSIVVFTRVKNEKKKDKRGKGEKG